MKTLASDSDFNALVARSLAVLRLHDQKAMGEFLTQNGLEAALNAIEVAWESLSVQDRQWWLEGQPDRFSQTCRAVAVKVEAQIAAQIRSELGNYDELRRTVHNIFSRRDTSDWQKLLTDKSKWSVQLLLGVVREIWPWLVPETKSWWLHPGVSGQTPYVEAYNAAVDEESLLMLPDEEDLDDDVDDSASEDDDNAE